MVKNLLRSGLIKCITYLTPNKIPMEIHVEKLDETLPKLQKYVSHHPRVMLMVEPTLSSPEAIRQLRKCNNPIGLHAHIAIQPEIDTVPLRKQYDLIAQRKTFLEKITGLNINHFAPGWWALNSNTLLALKKLAISHVHIYHTFFRQQSQIKQACLKPLIVQHYLHDYDL